MARDSVKKSFQNRWGFHHPLTGCDINSKGDSTNADGGTGNPIGTVA